MPFFFIQKAWFSLSGVPGALDGVKPVTFAVEISPGGSTERVERYEQTFTQSLVHLFDKPGQIDLSMYTQTGCIYFHLDSNFSPSLDYVTSVDQWSDKIAME